MKGCHWLGMSLWSLAAAAAPAQDNPPISLAFQEAPVAVILQALADYRQLNVIVAAGVSGTLTLRLDNVPWPQALALVLRMGKLSMTREGNVLLVSPEPDAQEQQQRQQALALRQPLHSLTLALKNADAAEVAETLNAQRGALPDERGSVVADRRTNALLIRDTASGLALLKKRVAEMDRPLAQVQLAAHIVHQQRKPARSWRALGAGAGGAAGAAAAAG
ncbi:Type IV pilus biogenesis and competence protein pilQ precursor [Serratia ficaria]|nr:Type IV pilus biogenesis and competence protein pilQ precursor [Serratia ficaria]